MQEIEHAHTRRNIITHAIGATVAVGIVAAGTRRRDSHPDATLLAACQAYIDMVTADRARDEAMTEAERRETYRYTSAKTFLGEDRPGDVMAKQIAALPAVTLDGRKARARALRYYYGGDDETDPFGWRGVDVLLSAVIADTLHGSAGA